MDLFSYGECRGLALSMHEATQQKERLKNTIASWSWRRRFTPREEALKARNMSKCANVRCMNPPTDWAKCRENDTVLITGDGRTLSDDVKQFESWKISHDVFCVNRSLLYFQRPINHWAAVDAEESVWFSQYCNSDVLPKGKWIWRHIIGVCRGYDFYWQGLGTFKTEVSKTIWPGNSGYFAMMVALEIGYDKVILAGMPLDRNPCWYEPEDKPGPNWIGAMYTQWMDWKTESPNNNKVRSMSGYSAFIVGKACKTWCGG